MPSSKSYLEFILEQLSPLEDISYRAMMGEYIIRYKEKIIGGIYDDRFLVKPVSSAVEYVKEEIWEYPYENGRKMLLADDADNSEYLCGLIRAMYDELPLPKSKKKKT